jgi:hypothetical protein
MQRRTYDLHSQSIIDLIRLVSHRRNICLFERYGGWLKSPASSANDLRVWREKHTMGRTRVGTGATTGGCACDDAPEYRDAPVNGST